MKSYAVILASGSSSRFGGDIPKQFLKIDGKTILEHSIYAFEINENITDIILVCNPDYIDLAKNILSNKFSKIKTIVAGGKTRQESASIGVSFIEEDNSKVLIHDAARPFVSQKIINNCIQALDNHQACCVAVPCIDTIIKINESNVIEQIPNRNSLKRVQTPQGFIASIIKQAHIKAIQDKDIAVTDDCGLVLHYNLSPIIVLEGEESNIKITHKKDLE